MSTTGCLPFPCVGYSTSPGIYSRKKGLTAFNVSSERQYQCRINEIAHASKQQDVVLNPGTRDRKSDVLPQNHRVPVNRNTQKMPRLMSLYNKSINNIINSHCTNVGPTLTAPIRHSLPNIDPNQGYKTSCHAPVLPRSTTA